MTAKKRGRKARPQVPADGPMTPAAQKRFLVKACAINARFRHLIGNDKISWQKAIQREVDQVAKVFGHDIVTFEAVERQVHPRAGDRASARDDSFDVVLAKPRRRKKS